jgi:hypothetical protein
MNAVNVGTILHPNTLTLSSIGKKVFGLAAVPGSPVATPNGIIAVL